MFPVKYFSQHFLSRKVTGIVNESIRSSGIALITDSTCDVPQELIDQYGILMVPHYVIWGDEQFLDRVNLQPVDFYQRIETDPVRPTSSQATSQGFTEKYNQAITNGAQEIVVITISSAMSGAFQAARSAAEMVKIPVYVVDSKGPTMSEGWQVLAAARVREQGGNSQEMLAKVEQVRQTLVQVVGMEGMDFLSKGGRIGDAAKWIGSALQIKPVVSINHISGKVEPVGLARTHKNMVEMLYKTFFKRINTAKPMHIAVLHGNVLSEAETLARRIQKEFSPLELILNITGPVLGINTGPRALALCGYTE